MKLAQNQERFEGSGSLNRCFVARFHHITLQQISSRTQAHKIHP